MKVYFLIILVFCSQFVIYSQDMLGIINSNYAGIYGISLNPASMVGSKLYMDYSLVTFQSSFVNSYAYIERPDYLDYLFHGDNPVYYTDENEDRNYSIYRTADNYYGYLNQRIMGPAAMIVDGKHAYGLTTALRTNFSFHHLPNDIGEFLYEAIDYDAQHGITYIHEKDIQIGTLTWFEINFSYAYNFRRYKWESWSAGITVKPLLGSVGTYANIYDVSYRVHNDDSATVYNTSFDYSYSIPVNYEDNNLPQNPLIRGFGLGFDLGVTYSKTTKGHSVKHYGRLCEQQYEAYNYKIGISLVDVGYIRFTKNAELKSYYETFTEWYKPDDSLPENSVNEITAKIDSYFEENAAEVTVQNEFVMHIPPALILQCDRAINEFIYINGTLIYGFSLGKSFIKRPSVLAITPRIETARFEVSLPISIMEWNLSFPRIGFSVRYGNFFIGFDKINTVIGFKDFNSFDVYCGLRLNLSNNFRMNYIKGLCGNKRLRNIEMFDYRNF
jgi:hypothetical protein